MAKDLSRELERLCAQVTLLRCQKKFVLPVHFSSNPDSLAWLTGRERRMFDEEGNAILPAVTLVGVPEDERAYQALLRGYEAYTAAALVARVIGWECGNPLDFYAGLLEDRYVCVAQ